MPLTAPICTLSKTTLNISQKYSLFSNTEARSTQKKYLLGRIPSLVVSQALLIQQQIFSGKISHLELCNTQGSPTAL